MGRTTVSRILKCEGIKPDPDRPSSWSTFIKTTWGECAAVDFFTTEAWTAKGLTTFHTLFVIDLATRRACFAGATRTPDEAFMAQVARNLTDAVDGFPKVHTKWTVDRNTKFTQGFQTLLTSVGVETIFTSPSSPNCTSINLASPGHRARPLRRPSEALPPLGLPLLYLGRWLQFAVDLTIRGVADRS